MQLERGVAFKILKMNQYLLIKGSECLKLYLLYNTTIQLYICQKVEKL